MHIAAVVYVVSYFLPAYRIFSDFAPGYEIALAAESMTWEFSKGVVQQSWSAGTIPSVVGFGGAAENLWGDMAILGGAAANHLFVIAYIAALCRWLRTAAVCAWLAVVAATGCLLPGQLFETHWFLGPGYFLWCAAPVLLGFACGRPFRRASS